MNRFNLDYEEYLEKMKHALKKQICNLVSKL